MLEIFFHELDFFLVSVARHIHNGVFDAVGIGNFVKLEAFLLSGGLNEDVTVVEHGREETFYFACGVLDAEEVELAHGSDEESFLLDIYDALGSDDPNVEVVVNPDKKCEEPEENEKYALDECEELPVDGNKCIGIDKEKENEDTENDKETDYKGNELYENIEPVTMNYIKDFFIGVLPFEGARAREFFVGYHHRSGKKESERECVGIIYRELESVKKGYSSEKQ